MSISDFMSLEEMNILEKMVLEQRNANKKDTTAASNDIYKQNMQHDVSINNCKQDEVQDQTPLTVPKTT